jgi:membrane-bound serine protease (ClpP class)
MTMSWLRIFNVACGLVLCSSGFLRSAQEVAEEKPAPAATGDVQAATPAPTPPAATPAPAPTPPAAREAHLVRIPLPIVGTVDTQVKRQIDQLVSNAKPPRPLLVLEFFGADGQNGSGSEFERCLSLARYLASERLNGVRSVAFVPQTLVGHAVLPVLACEEIVISETAEFGEAGRDESFIDMTMRGGYSEIAGRRMTIPSAVALGMLDKQLTVYKVKSNGGTRYVLEEELRELQQKGAVDSLDTISRAGDWAKFTGRDMRLKYAWVSHLASDRKQLASALNLSPTALQENRALDGKWKPIRVDVRGPIHAQQITFVERNLRDRLARDEFNFVCVVVDSPGGSATDSWRLAQFLASEEMNKVRSVALVPTEALGSAALIALSCDQLVVGADAVLGGDGADELNQRERDALLTSLRETAGTTDREWSLFAAMIDPQLAIHRYTRQATGEVRYFSAEELASQADPAAWVGGEALDARDGLRGATMVELKLASATGTTIEEIKTSYHLEGDLHPIEPNWAHLFIERLAHPGVAGMLLFVAVFALMIEFSQPGVGLPGFVSAVCFVLYFWSHALHGTAGWLEILLFIAGVISVLVEIFVVPGGIVFGLGGGVLIISSIVLASQTFVIPRNAYQLGQLPTSLGTLGVIGASAFAALVIIRRYLPDAPVLKRMMLAPPDEDELEDLDQREALVHLHHLLGKRGSTLTPLMPSGKAMFGDDVVSVATEGQAIPTGTDVIAVADRGNYLLVEPADGRIV